MSADEGSHDPDREERADRTRLRRLQTIFLGVLAVLAVVVAMRATGGFLIPIVIAVLAQFVLSPVVRGMQRIGVSPPFSAAILMLLLAGAVGGAAFGLARPAQEWMDELPDARDLRSVTAWFDDVRAAAERVDDLAEVVSGDKKPEVVVDKGDNGGVLAAAPSLLGGALVCWFLLGFLLASHDSFLRSLVRTLPHLSDKKVAVEVLRSIEREVSRYLTTITLINIGLGIGVGLAMYLLDVPNPILWGAMATLLNYVPYAGALVGAAIVGLVALQDQEPEPVVLLVPLAYLALSGIEGMLVTPAILGRRMQLRPVAVLIALLFWGWLWGVAGALLAVPMLVVLKILCEHVDLLHPIGEFLGDPRATTAPVDREAGLPALPATGAQPEAESTPPA